MVDEKGLKSSKQEKSSKGLIKDLIRKLHEGKNPEEVKERFQNILRDVNSTEIAQAEQELVNEGMPQQEIRRLCDVHLAIFRESLEKEKVDVESNHPIRVFQEEHKTILQHLEELKSTVQKVDAAKSFEEITEEITKLRQIADHLMEVEKHNAREENVLFPYLEKHGITEPPAVMWAEHNELKEKKKKLVELLETPDRLAFQTFAKILRETANFLVDELSSHIYKENNILYPTALQTIKAEEWREVREQCDELGYCCFTPEHVKPVEDEEKQELKAKLDDVMGFETGSLIKEEIDAILDSLPVDVTFVDAEDTVRYFNKAEGRVFPRTKAIIGRKVQQCHPPKSVHVVNQVLDDLKMGRRKSADFWIDINQRKIYIRYFPVRNPEGKYLGCIEVTQDITDVQKMKGERRLLDETRSS